MATDSGSSSGRSIIVATKIAASLMRKGSTSIQLSVIVGRSRSSIDAWLAHFYDAGIIFVESWQPCQGRSGKIASYAAVWRWTDGEPFSRHDAVKPHVDPSRYEVVGKRKHTVHQYLTLVQEAKKYPTAKEAARALNVCYGTLMRAKRWYKTVYCIEQNKKAPR